MEQDIYIEFEKEDDAKIEFYKISQNSDETINKKIVLLPSYSRLEGKPVWIVSNYGNIINNFEKDYDAPSFFLWQFIVFSNTPEEIQTFLQEKSYLSSDGINGGVVAGLTSVIYIPSTYWVGNIAFSHKTYREDIYNWLSKTFSQYEISDKIVSFFPRRLRKDVDVDLILDRIKYSDGLIIDIKT